MKKIIFVVALLLSSFTASAVTVNAVNSGWYKSTGNNNGTTNNINAVGNQNNWLGFDLGTVTGTILSATLEVGSDNANLSGQAFKWSEVSTSYGLLGVINSSLITTDLGSGNVFATGIHQAGVINSFTLNALGIASLNAATSFWAIGGHNSTNHNAFGWTGGVSTQDHIKLVLNTGVSEVPIPAAAFMFAPALLGFMGLRRRAKNKA